MTLEQGIHLLAAATLFELMIAIGLGVTLTDVLGVARDWRVLARALLANYVCFPLIALGLLLLLRPWSLDPTNYPLIAAGFLIATVCPGAPYGPPFTALARGNEVLSIGLMIVLAGSSALLAPLLLYLLLPCISGDMDVQVPFVKMAVTLLVAQFLPLCAGLGVRHWYPALAERLKKPATRLSVVLNLVLLGVIFVVQSDTLLQVPLHGFLGMTVLVLSGVGLGWLLGGPGRANRTAMALSTAARNVRVGLVIATTAFPGTRAVTAATVFALFQTVVVALMALAWGRLARESNQSPSSDPVRK